MQSETTLNIATRQVGEKTLVDIQADNIDFRNCEVLKTAFANLVGEGHRSVVLNLSQVSFMDSAGLGAILFCKKACDEVTGALGVYGLQKYVQNLFNLTHLHKALSVFASEEEATA